jgi:hypothetical protein
MDADRSTAPLPSQWLSIVICCLSLSVVVPLTLLFIAVCHNSFRCPLTSVQRPSTSIRSSSFILIDALYFSNRMYYVHTYSITYSSNRMYVFFKIVYKFLKLICTPTYSRINIYIYVFRINTYI